MRLMMTIVRGGNLIGQQAVLLGKIRRYDKYGLGAVQVFDLRRAHSPCRQRV